MIVKLASDSTNILYNGRCTSTFSRNISYVLVGWQKLQLQGLLSVFTTGKTGPLPHYGSFISRIFLEYFHAPRKTFPYYGIGQNYGNWIFQPFFLTILTRYFHTMEEVQFFQCTYLTMLSTGRYTCFSSPGSVCWGIPACKDIPSCVKVRSPSCFHSLWTFLVPAVWVYRSRLQPCLLMLNITMYENRFILTIKTTTRGINTIIWPQATQAVGVWWRVFDLTIKSLNAGNLNNNK